MEKRNIKPKDILSYFLSPGDIYWKQRSGTLVCINKRGEPLNIDLLHKLFEGEQNLIITNEVDSSFEDYFISLFDKYEAALLIKEKLGVRREIITMFKEVADSKIEQYEFAMMGWRIFSQLDPEMRSNLIDKDADIVKRSVFVASSTCYLAFVVGYYDLKFLSKVFSHVLMRLINATSEDKLRDFKIFCEGIRQHQSMTADEKEKLLFFIEDKNSESLFYYEQFDGSGILEINAREMTDLDLISIAMNKNYSYLNFNAPNIFKQVLYMEIVLEKHVIDILKKEFKYSEENILIAGKLTA